MKHKPYDHNESDFHKACDVEGLEKKYNTFFDALPDIITRSENAEALEEYFSKRELAALICALQDEHCASSHGSEQIRNTHIDDLIVEVISKKSQLDDKKLH